MSNEFEPEDVHAEPDVIPGAEAARGTGIRFLVIGGALAAIGIFAGFVWYAYDQSAKKEASDQPPLIKADKGPTKVKPDTPGGMEVPHQDKTVYNRMVAGARDKEPERLMPAPEKPMKKPEEPDAELLSDLFSDQAPAAPGVPGAKTPVIVDLLPPKTTTPAPKPTKAPPPVKVPATTLDKKSAKFLIQIGAFRDRAGADAGWARLRKRHGTMLTGLEPDIMRADLGAKGVFYRLRAGPLGDKASADKLCTQMKEKKIGCLVVKP
jgi:cell division protein FtsN